jgi:Thaumatin family
VTTTMQKCLLAATLVTLTAADLGAINQTVTITNSTSGSRTIYIGFNGASLGPYSQSDFPFCTFPAQGNPYACSFTLASGKSQPIQLTKGNFNVAISADILVWSSCGGGTGLSMAELNLNTQGNDWYDVSLVNGFNYGVSIKPSSGNAITVTSATGNSKNPGVYPLGCDICTGPSNPPTGPGCPGKNYPQEGHVNTQPPCQFNQPSVASYTVTFTNPT